MGDSTLGCKCQATDFLISKAQSVSRWSPVTKVIAMAAQHTGPGPSLGIGAVFGTVFAVMLFFHSSSAAPVVDHPTAVDEYYAESGGCYYNFQHYGEGDRIITNEPCLNCTCHNRMLMCYLRVCPFTKAIGQDCKVEKKPEQCCPIITCPEVPVHLLTSSTTTATPPTPAGSTAVGHPDNYGCTIDEVFYTDGAQVPGDSSKPCELCYCIRNRTACVMQECTLHVEGCRPVYAEGICCPVRYDCDYQEATEVFPETTVRPTPGLVLTTTTPGPLDCHYGEDTFADGALLPKSKPCEHCYCMRGDIVCAVQECGSPLDHEGKNCTALPPQPGQCCTEQYQCETEIRHVNDLSLRQNRKHENDSDDNGTIPVGGTSQEQETESIPKEPSQEEQSATSPTPIENDEQTQHVEENEIEHNQQNIHETGQEVSGVIDQAPEAVEGEIEHVTEELQHLTTQGIPTQSSSISPSTAEDSHFTEVPAIEHGQIDQGTSSPAAPNPSSEQLTTQGIETVTHGTQDENHGVLESASQMGQDSEGTVPQHVSQTEVLQTVTGETPQELTPEKVSAVTDSITGSEITTEDHKPQVDITTEAVHQEHVSENIISLTDNPQEQHKPEGVEAATEGIQQELGPGGTVSVSEIIQEHEPPVNVPEITQQEEHPSEGQAPDGEEGTTETGLITEVHEPEKGADGIIVTTEAIQSEVSASELPDHETETKPSEDVNVEPAHEISPEIISGITSENENIPEDNTKKPVSGTPTTEAVLSETGAEGIIQEQVSETSEAVIEGEQQESSTTDTTTGEGNAQVETGATQQENLPESIPSVTETNEMEIAEDVEAETEEHLSITVTEAPEDQKPGDLETGTEKIPPEHVSEGSPSTTGPTDDQKPESVEAVTEEADLDHVSEEQKPESITESTSPEHVSEGISIPTDVPEGQGTGNELGVTEKEEHAPEVTITPESSETQKPESEESIPVTEEIHVSEGTLSTTEAVQDQKPEIIEAVTEEIQSEYTSENVISVTEGTETQKPESVEAEIDGAQQEHTSESAPAITEADEVATESVLEQKPETIEEQKPETIEEQKPELVETETEAVHGIQGSDDLSTDAGEEHKPGAVEVGTESPQPELTPEATHTPPESTEDQKPEHIQPVTDGIEIENASEVSNEVTDAPDGQKPESEDITTEKVQPELISEDSVTESIEGEKPVSVEPVISEVSGGVSEEHLPEITTPETVEAQRPVTVEAPTEDIQQEQVSEAVAIVTESNIGPEISEAVTNEVQPEHVSEGITTAPETSEGQKPEVDQAVTQEVPVQQEHVSETVESATAISETQEPESMEPVTDGVQPEHVPEVVSTGTETSEEGKPENIGTVTESVQLESVSEGISSSTMDVEEQKPEAVEAVTQPDQPEHISEFIDVTTMAVEEGKPGSTEAVSEDIKPEHGSEGTVTGTEATEGEETGSTEAVTESTKPEHIPENQSTGGEGVEETKPEIPEAVTEEGEPQHIPETLTTSPVAVEAQKPESTEAITEGNEQEKLPQVHIPVTEAGDEQNPDDVGLPTEYHPDDVSDKDASTVGTIEGQKPEDDESAAVTTEGYVKPGVSSATTVSPQELKPDGTPIEDQEGQVLGVTDEHIPSISSAGPQDTQISTESSVKVTDKLDELTSLSFVSSSPAGESSQYPSMGPSGISSTTSAPLQGIVPGEGNCLVEGQTYQNNSNIPPINPCVLSCRCVSSIVHCVKIPCSPPPAGHTNCVPVKHGEDACCDTYLCDGDEKPGLESDSQMAATEEPVIESQKEPATPLENVSETQESAKPVFEEKPQVEQTVKPEDQQTEHQTVAPEQSETTPSQAEQHRPDISVPTQESVIEQEQESGTGKPTESESGQILTTQKPAHGSEAVEDEEPEQPVDEQTEKVPITDQPAHGQEASAEQKPEHVSSTVLPPQNTVESIVVQESESEHPSEEQTEFPLPESTGHDKEQTPEAEVAEEHTEHLSEIDDSTRPAGPVETQKPESEKPSEETIAGTDRPIQIPIESTDEQNPEDQKPSVEEDTLTEQLIHEAEESDEQKPIEGQTEETPTTHKPAHGPAEPIEEHTEFSPVTDQLVPESGETSPEQKPESPKPADEQAEEFEVTGQPVQAVTEPTESQKPEYEKPVEEQTEHTTEAVLGEPQKPGTEKPVDEQFPFTQQPVQPDEQGQTNQTPTAEHPTQGPVVPAEEESQKPLATEEPILATITPVEVEKPESEAPMAGEAEQPTHATEGSLDETMPEGQTESSVQSPVEPVVQQESEKPSEELTTELPSHSPVVADEDHTHEYEKPSGEQIPGTEHPGHEAVQPIEHEEPQTNEPTEKQTESPMIPSEEHTEEPLKPVQTQTPSSEKPSDIQTEETTKPVDEVIPETEKHTEQPLEPVEEEKPQEPSGEHTEQPVSGLGETVDQKPESEIPIEEQTAQSVGPDEAQKPTSEESTQEGTELPTRPIDTPIPEYEKPTEKPTEQQIVPEQEKPAEEQTEQTFEPVEDQKPEAEKPSEEQTETPVQGPVEPTEEEKPHPQRPDDEQTERPIEPIESEKPESQEPTHEQTEQPGEPAEVPKPESEKPVEEQTKEPIEVGTQIPEFEKPSEEQTEQPVEKPTEPSKEQKPESEKPADEQTEPQLESVEAQKPESQKPTVEQTERPSEPAESQEPASTEPSGEDTKYPAEPVEAQEPESDKPAEENTVQPLVPAEAEKPDTEKPGEGQTEQTTEHADGERPTDEQTDRPIDRPEEPVVGQKPESEQPSDEQTEKPSSGQESTEGEESEVGKPQEGLTTEYPSYVPDETQKPESLRPDEEQTEQTVELPGEDIEQKPKPEQTHEEQTEKTPVVGVEEVKPEYEKPIEEQTEVPTHGSVQPVEVQTSVSEGSSIEESEHSSSTHSILLEPVVTASPDEEKPSEELTEHPLQGSIEPILAEKPSIEQTEQTPGSESVNEQKPLEHTHAPSVHPTSEQGPTQAQPTHSPSEATVDLKPASEIPAEIHTEGTPQEPVGQVSEAKPQPELPTQEQIPEFEEPSLKPSDEEKPDTEPVIGTIEHVTQVAEHPATLGQSTEGFGMISSTGKPIPEQEHQPLYTTEGSLLSSITEGLISHPGHMTTENPTTGDHHEYPHHPQHPDGQYEHLPGGDVDTAYPPSSPDEADYDEEQAAFGPGTCRYGGKVYVSAQQIPREDPCDFCFCFRSDIICLQQSCPPPIPDCRQEPIDGFCCPRYQCEVSMATMVNVSTTTTTTTTTLPPHFLSHAYKGSAVKTGCQVQGHAYRVGEVVRSASGPCLLCRCGGDGQMKCDPKECSPEPMLRKMIMAAASRRR
ncbi:titin homolog [Anabrus simplex]|uniref:titin homolog n=1 Tax=Anabrus simplex TaxID=316456 RepID=UPI0035A348F9